MMFFLVFFVWGGGYFSDDPLPKAVKHPDPGGENNADLNAETGVGSSAIIFLLHLIQS